MYVCTPCITSIVNKTMYTCSGSVLWVKTFASCGKRHFVGEAGGHTYYNAWAESDEQDLIGMNKLKERERYEVDIIDRGYHVYVVVWEAALDKYCLASER